MDYPTEAETYGDLDKAAIARREPLIVVGMDRLTKSVEHAHDLLTALYDRTESVRVSSPTEALGVRAETRDSPSQSPLADRIDGVITQVQGLHRRIEGLLETIEV